MQRDVKKLAMTFAQHCKLARSLASCETKELVFLSAVTAYWLRLFTQFSWNFSLHFPLIQFPRRALVTKRQPLPRAFVRKHLDNVESWKRNTRKSWVWRQSKQQIFSISDVRRIQIIGNKWTRCVSAGEISAQWIAYIGWLSLNFFFYSNFSPWARANRISTKSSCPNEFQIRNYEVLWPSMASQSDALDGSSWLLYS